MLFAGVWLAVLLLGVDVLDRLDAALLSVTGVLVRLPDEGFCAELVLVLDGEVDVADDGFELGVVACVADGVFEEFVDVLGACAKAAVARMRLMADVAKRRDFMFPAPVHGRVDGNNNHDQAQPVPARREKQAKRSAAAFRGA